MANAFYFLITLAFDLALFVVILRWWLQWNRADFYNPMSQFVVKATNPLILPLRRIIPAMGKVDSATVLTAFLVSLAKVVAVALLFTGFSSIAVLLLKAGLNIVLQGLYLLFYILLARAIMSWFSQGRTPMEHLFSQLTEPLVAPIRRVIPPIGMLDLSTMVLVIAIIFVRIIVETYYNQLL
jgi:YggT family protein